jgi:RNA polymerase sigma-70 factor (ECF subfamily)
MQDNKLIKALVLNAQLGNNSAFEQLYQMTIEQIYALTLRLTGDASFAETLTKEVYVNAWQKISQKDEFASFANWLKKIAAETILQEKNELIKGEKTTEVNSLYNDPFEANISDLELNNRFVYVLHDIEHFSFEEISKLLNISVKEIKTLLVNSREKLINLIEE